MMETDPGAARQQKILEDPLAYLPCSRIAAYKKEEAIYRQGDPANNIFLIIEGTVKVYTLHSHGRQVVIDIYQLDEFFGEQCLLHPPHRAEHATAMKDVKLMTWTALELEAIMEKQPKLAIALLQLLVRRTMEFRRRVESFSAESVPCRVARSLMIFAERLGTPQESGWVQMASLTHELLSQYVGTSRELVTHCLNRLRRQGFLRYSRQHMAVHRAGLAEWLRQNSARAVVMGASVVAELALGNSPAAS